MTIELEPTISLATSPGNQTTASEPTHPKLSGYDCQCPSSLFMFLPHFQLMTNNRTSNVLPKPITKMPILLISPSPTFFQQYLSFRIQQNSCPFFPLLSFPTSCLPLNLWQTQMIVANSLLQRVLNKWSQFDFSWEGFTYFNIKV